MEPIHCTACGDELDDALHGYQDKGADADDAASKGRPFKARPGHYRAGYSLNHRWL